LAKLPKINKGKQFFIPFDYSFCYVAFDNSLFSDKERGILSLSDKFTIKSLVETGETPFNLNAGTYMFGLAEADLFYLLFRANYSGFIDFENKTANFDDGRFASLLTTAADYADKGYLMKNEDYADWVNSFYTAAPKEQKHFFYKLNQSTSLEGNFNDNEKAASHIPRIESIENDIVAGVLTGDKNELYFTTRNPHAINANSANKRTSWEFIKFTLSEEQQTAHGLLSTTPINKKALERSAMINLSGKFEMQWEIPEDIKAMMNPAALAAIEELKKTFYCIYPCHLTHFPAK
jgi:ABC-type glycerol-3-phosphate transport system substrate-binding protein